MDGNGATRDALRWLAHCALAIWPCAAALLAVDILRCALPGDAPPVPDPAACLALLALYASGLGLILVPAAVALAAWRWLARRRPGSFLESAWIPAAAWALSALAPLVLVGRDLASGEWISIRWFAPIVMIAVPAVGAAAVAVLGRFAFGAGATADRRGGPWPAVLGLAAAAGACLAADRLVYPGLYDSFHLAAFGLGAAGLCVASCRAARHLLRGVRPSFLAIASILAALLLAGTPPVWSAAGPRTRAAMMSASSFAANVFRHLLPAKRSDLLEGVLVDLLLDLDNVRFQDVGASYSPLRPAGEERAGDRCENAVLVIFDALRADALPPLRTAAGARFSRPEDTPFLDRWLEGASKFRHAYAAGSITNRSMPALFRSVELLDRRRLPGSSLGRRLALAGRWSIASVSPYFVDSPSPHVADLTDGFDEVIAFSSKEQERAVPDVLDALGRLDGEPFFLWIHFQATHDPGFDGRLLPYGSPRDERYRRSLHWLDGQFRLLVEGLERLGLAGDTAVILGSDHGENIGDNDQTYHGKTVFEEEVHVPLAIRLPGGRGSDVGTVVGNIDIVPTVLELLGQPPRESDDGRSLLGLIGDPAADWNRSYHFTDKSLKLVGVVKGRQKLVYDSRADAFFRFDLESDPREYANRFDPGGDTDRELLRHLVIHNPRIAGERGKGSRVRELLSHRLATATSREALPFLIELAILHPDAGTENSAVEAFRRAEARSAARIAAHFMRRSPGRWGSLVEDRIRVAAGTPAELAFVDRLADARIREFAPGFVAGRMRYWTAAGGAGDWIPWLRMVEEWDKPAGIFGPALAEMLAGAADAGRPADDAVWWILKNVATTTWPAGRARGADAAALAGRARGFAGHERPRIRVAATEAIGLLGDEGDAEALREGIRDRGLDLRVRVAMARALARIAGEEAIPDLVEAAGEQRMLLAAASALAETGSRRALPALEKMAREAGSPYERMMIKSAIEAIGKGGGG